MYINGIHQSIKLLLFCITFMNGIHSSSTSRNRFRPMSSNVIHTIPGVFHMIGGMFNDLGSNKNGVQDGICQLLGGLEHLYTFFIFPYIGNVIIPTD